MRQSNRGAIPLRLAALSLILISLAPGQDYRGRIQGTVTDPNQAAVAGAKVTATRTETGVSFVRETGRGIMKGYSRRISAEDMP